MRPKPGQLWERVEDLGTGRSSLYLLVRLASWNGYSQAELWSFERRRLRRFNAGCLRGERWSRVG